MFERKKVLSVAEVFRGIEWLQRQVNKPECVHEARAVLTLVASALIAFKEDATLSSEDPEVALARLMSQIDFPAERRRMQEEFDKQKAIKNKQQSNEAERSPAAAEVELGPNCRNKRLILPLSWGIGKHCWVCVETTGISLGFTGGTTFEIDSDPVYLDFYDETKKAPVLYVWGDVNRSEPTVVLDLQYAIESARKPVAEE